MRRKPLLAAGALFLIVAIFITSIPSLSLANNKRQKVIDFEDEVVEGMNKRPLDSLNQISERDRKRRKPHLYRKRLGFRSETVETLRALRYTP
jgi:hypothetical protein